MIYMLLTTFTISFKWLKTSLFNRLLHYFYLFSAIIGHENRLKYREVQQKMFIRFNN